MSRHTDRRVFNLSHDLVIGWPSTFNMGGRFDDDTVMTMFYMNVPAADFVKIRKFQSLYTDVLEFCDLAFPFFTLGSLPGKPIDPHVWMTRGNLHTRIAPMRLGPSVRLTLEYTGLVPKGMRAGDRMRLVVMFMGIRGDEDSPF